jgi:predicted RNase H-like nuclease (RuvC/YqgF family)
MDVGIVKALLVTVGSCIGAFLVYKGGTFTAAKAKEGSDATASVSAQDSALKAWEGLLTPYRDEVASLRQEVAALTADLREERKERAAENLQQRERIGLLTTELGEWKRVAKVIAKWAMAMRDELLRQGGVVPATPEELVVLNSIDDTSKPPPT